MIQLRAKAVMERDLRMLRAKRAEKEKAAGILTKPAGVTKSPKLGTKKTPPPNGKDLAERQEEGKPHQEPQAMKGVIMDRYTAPQAPKPNQQSPQVEPAVSNGPTLEDHGNPATNVQHSELDPIVGLAINLQPDVQVQNDTGTAAPSQQLLQNLIEEPTQDQSDKSQPVDDQEAAPFESMFKDLEGGSNPASLDFDLEFPTTGDDLLNDDVLGDNVAASSANEDQNVNLAPTTAGDIDSLLPGLDDYVNDGADFSMLDMTIPAATSVPDASTTTNNATAQVPAPNLNNEGGAQTDSAPMESNFDDLFGGTDDWGLNDDMGNGTMGDFDEDWFNTDG